MRLFLTGLLLATLNARAAVTYSTVEEEFGEGTIHGVRVSSMDDSVPSILMVRCSVGSPIEISIEAPGDTMFPDSLNSDSSLMWISTKHKFDTAESAVDAQWAMKFMKYKKAFYTGDKDTFVLDAQAASKLSVRQEKSGATYRFDLSDAGDEFGRLIAGCEMANQ